MPVPTNDLLTLTPDAIIELYVLDLSPIGENVIYRFCNWTQSSGADIVFQGNTYTAMPLQANGFEINSRGQLPTPQIEFSNVLGVLTAFAIAYDDLIGAKVTRKRTLAKYLDGMPSANASMEYTPDTFIVYRKAEENELKIKFELRRMLDLGYQSKLPARLILKNTCGSTYRGSECGYTGGAIADENDNLTNDINRDKCGKRLRSCKLRFGAFSELPFGGFPGVDDL
jgi:lambda family phage minor tail protein L